MQPPKKLFFLSIAALCFVSAINCGAQEPQIQIVPFEKELILSGRPGSDASLTQRITLLSNKAVTELLFRPSDLHREGGTETISRTQLQPVSSIKLALAENTPQDFDFKVSGLKFPGTYSGSIDFLLPQHGTAPAIHLPLKLQVEETPKLALRKGSETLKIQLVNCSIISCYLGEHFSFLNSSPLENHSFPLDNGSRLPYTVDGSAAATGDINGFYTGDSLKLGLPMPIQPIPTVAIPFKIQSGQLTPDHYVGDVQLLIPGKDEPLKIPLEINVRTGPELPIIFILIGILFGRLIKYMKDKGTPQSDLLYQLLQLQTRAGQNPADLALLQHMLEGARHDINEMQLDQAKADLVLIGNRLTLLARLRYLETLLTPRSAEVGVPPILANIALARNQVSLGADPTATSTQIETQVQNLPAPGGPPNPEARAMELAAASGVRGAASITVAAAPLAVAADAPQVPLPRRLVGYITGHADALRANLTLWFLRPVLWMVLIFLLTGVGFMQLYLKNPTFGANFISDYFGLLVWATGSDVASRTLSNFKGS